MNWMGKRVLVTGADGLIGSHLTEQLVASEAEVRAFCFYNSNGSPGWLDDADPEVRGALEVRLGDIRDTRFVEEACEGVDTVSISLLIAIPLTTIPLSLGPSEAVKRNERPGHPGIGIG